MIETFINSFTSAAEGLALDFDTSNDLAHGNQEENFFHDYYYVLGLIYNF